MEFTAELYSRAWEPMSTGRLALAPTVYSSRRWGGPYRAEIAVTGDSASLWDALQWLRCGVIIRNPDGLTVWSGVIVEVLVGIGSAQVGRTLETMANKVKVAYSIPSTEGGEERATTDWASNSGSVSFYGTKERILSAGDSTQAQAEALRTTHLARNGLPPATFTLDDTTGATLVCVGIWQTLDWQYWALDGGKEEHAAAADTEHMLGWGIAAHTGKIGFWKNSIGDLDARFDNLIAGNRVTVDGSWGNDGDYTVVTPGDSALTPTTYASDGIAFDATDDLYDDDNGFGFITVGNMILTSGSVQSENNDTFWVTQVRSTGSIEVDQHGIVSEPDAPTITVKQGHYANFEETFVGEGVSLATYNVALTALGVKVAQQFRLSSTAGWSVREIRVQAKKVGSPTDNFRIRIYSDSAGSPNAELASATIAGADMPETMEWVSVTLSSSLALALATAYWVVVDRSGGLETDNFYVVGLESEKTYSPTAYMKIQRAVAGTWETRSQDAQMPFQLWALEDTTTQLGWMLAAAQFVAQVNTGTASGVLERSYREGDLTILEDAEKLLAAGTSAGGGLVVSVDQARSVRIYPEPAQSDLDWVLKPDGSIVHPLTGREQKGMLPAGEWVRVDGVPLTLIDVGRFLVDEAEYEVSQGRVRLTPRTWEAE